MGTFGSTVLGGIVALAAGPALAASLIAASPGYTYFNRPGSDLGSQQAALRECLGLAAQTKVQRALEGGLIGDMLQLAQEDHTLQANVENCMVVQGWRVVRLSDDEGRSLAGLGQADLAQRLSQWIGASQPHGDVVRAWANEAASHASRRTGQAPILGGARSLSLAALPPEGSTPVKPYKWEALPKSAGPLMHALKPEELASVPADSALVIFDIRGAGITHGMSFMREGPDIETPAWKLDGRSNILEFANLGPTFHGLPQAHLMAFALPPGRWALFALGGSYSLTSFCLGAAAFEAKAGEVLFAGKFDYDADQFRPDFALTDVSAALAPWPALAARLKPAPWINGTRGPCIGQNIYAFEVEGAPYVAGYHWGGAAAP
ncbi:MAG TPA: hypothetical protein VG939_01485 [Caulobacteraceae bacterium]|nr:hypothetical protein [Caulobacteraceae bacterium]